MVSSGGTKKAKATGAKSGKSDKKTQPNLRLFGVASGTVPMQNIARKFIREGGGTITSLDPRILPLAKQGLEPEIADSHLTEWIEFGQMVSQFASLVGLSLLSQADQSQSVAAIANMCQHLVPGSLFYRSGQFNGFHRAFDATFRELNAYGITPEKLIDLASEVEEPFASKLMGIAELGDAANGALRQIGRQANADRLHEILEVEKGLESNLGRWLIYAGSEPTPLDWAVMQKMAYLGATVWVVSERKLITSDLFGALESFPGYSKFESVGDFAPVALNLFGDKRENSNLKVRIVSAPDTLTEAEYILRDSYKQMESGINYSSMAIFVRDVADYAPLLESASRRLGIPVSISRRVKLLSNPLVRYLLSVLTACLDADVRKLVPMLSNSYSHLDAVKIKSISARLNEIHKAKSKQWELLEIATKETEIEWLEPLLLWRKVAVEQPTKLTDWLSRITVLATILPWQEGMPSESEQLSGRDIRAGTSLQRALSEQAVLEKVTENRSFTFIQAVDWIKNSWKNADVSLPSTEPGIRVVSSAMLLPETKITYAMGLVEGIFPRRPKDDPILNDLERARLTELAQLPVPLPTTVNASIAEREELVRLCSSPSQLLCLSLGVADESRNHIPAAYLDEVKKAVDETELISLSRSDAGLPNETSSLATDIQLLKAFEEEQMQMQAPAFTTQAALMKWKVPDSTPIKLTELKRVATCPFQSFARDRLGLFVNLNSHTEGVIWFGLFKLPEVARLPVQPDPESAKKALLTALDKYIDDFRGTLSDWEMTIVRHGALKIIDGWVEREFNARNHWRKNENSIISPGLIGKDLPNTILGSTIYGYVPGTFEMENYSGVQLYQQSAPEKWEDLGRSDFSNGDRVFYGGLMALLSRNPNKRILIEIDSASQNKRRMIVTPRGNLGLIGDQSKNLEVVEPQSSSSDSFRATLDLVKEPVRRALQDFRSGSLEVIPGDCCKRCAYGELCRASQVFGDINLTTNSTGEDEYAG